MAAIRPRIPPPAVPVVDPGTGLMTVDWYDFLVSATQPELLGDYANDAAAKAGGVPLFGLYRTAAVVKVRVT